MVVGYHYFRKHPYGPWDKLKNTQSTDFYPCLGFQGNVLYDRDHFKLALGQASKNWFFEHLKSKRKDVPKTTGRGPLKPWTIWCLNKDVF